MSWQDSFLGLQLQGGAREKIGADHFEAVTARLVRAQHQSSCFKGFFNNSQLTFIDLEIQNFPRFRLFPRQVSSRPPF